jgi:hypothetical protein
MSNQVKNPPELTQWARTNLNPVDLPVTWLIYPIVYVALKRKTKVLKNQNIHVHI